MSEHIIVKVDIKYTGLTIDKKDKNVLSAEISCLIDTWYRASALITASNISLSRKVGEGARR